MGSNRIFTVFTVMANKIGMFEYELFFLKKIWSDVSIEELKQLNWRKHMQGTSMVPLSTYSLVLCFYKAPDSK